MYPTGPGFDYDEYLRNMNRTLNAAGGGTESPPDPAATDAPPAPLGMTPGPSLDSMTPNRTQQRLESDFGIKTYGPNAREGQKAQQAYRQGEENFVEHTGQGRPQEYGVAEPDHSDETPLSPRAAAETFDALNPTKEDAALNAKKHLLGSGTPDEIRKRNAGYQDYVQKTERSRDAERGRLREQGALNRADAASKDADAWAQMREQNSLQGAAPSAQFSGGPMMQNVGGALLLGPGFGQSPFGHRGYGSGATPEQLDLQRQRLEEAKRLHDINANLGQGKLDQYQRKTDAAVDAETGRQNRFDTTHKIQDRDAAVSAQTQLNKIMGELDRRHGEFSKTQDPDELDREPPTQDKATGKPIPGLVKGGSADLLRRQVVALNRRLIEAHKNGVYDYVVTPDVQDKLRHIAGSVGANRMVSPADDQ